jgi:mycothiol synthase
VGLTARGYLDGDAPALAALLNRIKVHAGGHPYLIADELRSRVNTVVRHHTEDARVLFMDGELVAFAGVPTPPVGGFRVVLMGGVDPRWRGRGIGRGLLDWQLRRAGQIHAAVAPERDWAIHLEAADGDADAKRLYQRFGLAPVRHWLQMTAPTIGVPDMAAPAGLAIVGYEPGREAQLHAAHSDAFAGHWGFQPRGEDVWLARTVHAGNFLRRLSRLALTGDGDADGIAGYVLTYASPELRRAYVGQVGVRPRWRRRGLAAAMLADVLTACSGAGFEVVSLDVDAASPTRAVAVYERVGFVVRSRSATYSTALPALAAPWTG